MKNILWKHPSVFYLTFLFLFIIAPGTVSVVMADAQHRLDSLRQLLPHAEDTLRSGIYIRMAKIYSREFWLQDSALLYTWKAIGVTKSRTFPEEKLRHRYTAYGELAIAYHHLGIMDSALYYDNLALEYWKNNNEPNREVDAASRMVHHYFKKGDFKKGHEMIAEYDKVLDKLGDTLIIANYNNTIGAMLSEISDSSAISRLQKAYDLFKQINSQYAPNTLINIGAWYLTNKKDLKLAEQYYRQYLQEIPENDSTGMACFYISIGSLYTQKYKGRSDSSAYYLKRGLAIAQSGNMTEYASKAAYFLAVVYYRAGQYREALKYCDITLELAKSGGDIIRKWRILNLLDDVYQALGEPEKAYETLKKFTVLNDSLNLDKQEKEIRNIELQRKMENMEQQKMILQKDVKILKLRNSIGGLIIASLLLLGVLLIVNTIRLNRKRKQLFHQLHEMASLKNDRTVAITDDATLYDEANDSVQGDSSSEMLERQGMNEETSRHILHMIRIWIGRKGFLEKVTIHDVASRIKTNSKYLSEVIMSEYKVASFNEFLNQQRIHYLLKILESENVYRNYTVESLAGYVGYGSKTTFIKAFKEITGLTPNFYLEQLRKQEPVPVSIAG